MNLLDKYSAVIEAVDPIKYTGIVQKVVGLLVESTGPQAVVGELCQIIIPKGSGTVWAEVVGLKGKTVQLMPYTDMNGIEVGCLVVATGDFLKVPVTENLLGRTLDCMGRPIDEMGDIAAVEWYPLMNDPPDVLKRKRISDRIVTGIRAIDGLTPVGRGQRLGVFAGSGVGKSTIMGMIARYTSADVNVIALIGERGREVREFLENDLGPEGLARSVVIVSGSNMPPLARIRGAFVATAIAEYFRDQGKNVMLLFDSVTRFAMAQREIGLAIGEPPATRGYTPSVFSTLPKLLERCGTSDKGTITGFYTILVEGDDMDEPVADTVRGILDGHIVLSRKLAQRYHYPAIDILQSVSRLATIVANRDEQKAAGIIKRMLAIYNDSEDLINVGAYVKGSNPEIDEAIKKMPEILNFLRQDILERAEMQDTLLKMDSLSGIRLVERPSLPPDSADEEDAFE